MAETAEAPAPPAIQWDQIVERYIQLRDRKTALKSDYEKSVAAIDQAMERVEAYMLTHLTNTGSESVRTAAGTFYKQLRNSATVADFDLVREWIEAEPDARWPMLEKRVSKAFVEAFKEEHNDLPPGINWRSETVVNVRRT